MLRPSGGAEYYADILLYVDDILCIHHDAGIVLTKIDKCFKLKLDSKREPYIYLGSKLWPMKLYNGVWSWALIPSQYVQEIFQIVQKYVKNLCRR